LVALFYLPCFLLNIPKKNCLAANLVAPNVSPAQAFFLEVVLTFFLLFIVAAATDSAKANTVMVPFAIGMAVFVCHLVAIPIDGMSLNPARSFGPAIVSSGLPGCGQVWDYHYIFWFGPVFGAILGLVAYETTFALKGRRSTLLDQYISPHARLEMEQDAQRDLLALVIAGDHTRGAKVETLDEGKQTELGEFVLEKGSSLATWYTRGLCCCICTFCLIWPVYLIKRNQAKAAIEDKIDQLAGEYAAQTDGNRATPSSPSGNA